MRKVLDVSLALAALAVLVRAAVRAVHLQWDFRVYLAAARAARQGLDPYVIENLRAVSERHMTLPFLYPPAALVPFLALSTLPEPVALAVWAGLKVVLLVFMVVLWKRVFLPGAPWSQLAWVAVLASNASAIWDVRSGNVGLVEAALVWAALAFYVRGQLRMFAALVVLAATFKLIPAVFLFLLLVPPRRHVDLFVAATVAYLLVVFLPVHVGPSESWENFLHVVPAAIPQGDANPSLLSFLLGRFPTGAAIALWVASAAALFALSWPALRRLDPCGLALASVGLDLLVSPRPMAYGWAIGGATLVALIRKAVPGALARTALTVLVVLQGALFLLSRPLQGTLADALPWLVLLGLWLLARFVPDTGTLHEEPLPARVS